MKGRMTLKELEEFKNFNEVDLARKIKEMADLCEKTAQKVVKGNIVAQVTLRKNMNDMRLMCMIMRDMVKIRRVPEKKNIALEHAIQMELDAIARENKKKRLASDEVVAEQVRKIKLAETIRRESREQKAKEGKRPAGSEPQKAEDQL